MFPYQIYQALMDEHVHELQAAARRHERLVEVRLAAGRRERTTRIRDAFGHLVALARTGRTAEVRRGAHAPSSTAGSTAGPMGCVA